MNKKLQKQIENQLEKLSKLLDNIQEAQIIVPQESETWDSDTLYDLVEQLKEALKLLEDQKAPDKSGLCSLVDAYQSEDEEDYE